MRTTILFSIAGGVVLATAGGANAQGMPGGAPAAPTNMGGPRTQDIAAANREVDSDYNTIAGRGVKVTNQSRADSGTGSRQKHSSAVAATAADITAGAQVRDVKGVPLGTIAVLAANEVVADDAEQAVIDTGQIKIGVPLSAFGKDDKGLLLSITAEKFNQLVAQAHAGSSAQPAQSN